MSDHLVKAERSGVKGEESVKKRSVIEEEDDEDEEKHEMQVRTLREGGRARRSDRVEASGAVVLVAG